MPRRRLRERKLIKSRTAQIRFRADDLRLVDQWAKDAGLTRSDVVRALVDQEKQRRVQAAAWNGALALSPSAAIVVGTVSEAA